MYTHCIIVESTWK